MLENALPLILLLLPIVLGAAATLLLFINLEEDPFKSLDATKFAAITLVVAAVAFGLVYFLTLSLPASGAVSAYVLAMITGGPFLHGAYNISSLKADGRGAALMFRWSVGNPQCAREFWLTKLAALGSLTFWRSPRSTPLS